MLSRFLARTLSGDSLSRTERTMTCVVFVILELFVVLFVASAASMFGGIFGGEQGALSAGLVSMTVYAVAATVAWVLPAKRRA